MLLTLDSFWSRHPALLYGLSGLLSLYYVLDGGFFCLVLLLGLSLSSTKGLRRFVERVVLLWALNLSVMAYTAISYKLPELPEEGITGQLHFIVEAIQYKETAFGRQKIYRGTGKLFQPMYSIQNEYRGKSFPCTITFSERKNRSTPKGDQDYFFNGILKQRPTGAYFFIPHKESRWIPVEGSYSRAQLRASLKESVRNFLRKRISDSRSAAFLSGIVTGQFEDRMQTFLFKQSGLLHLMAISGFHFSLLAAIFALFCRIFFSLRVSALISMIALSAYFLFLGESPSILRAWAMISVLFLGMLLQKKSAALNALGVSLLIMLIFNPLSLCSVGFQLSAAITASILLLYPIVNERLRSLIVTRPFSVIKKMSLIDQHFYCVLWSFREALTLMFAVNIIAIPLSFYYFGSFSLSGLLYNLFIPFLVGCALFGLLCAFVIFAIFPSLGNLVFSLTSWFTSFTLNFVYDAPAFLRMPWHVDQISGIVISCYLTMVYIIAISQQKKELPFGII